MFATIVHSILNNYGINNENYKSVIASLGDQLFESCRIAFAIPARTSASLNA
jgi:hypothetical protein